MNDLQYYAVRITTPLGCGSGVIVNPDEKSDSLYILTAVHVVKGVSNSDIIIEHINNTEVLAKFTVEKKFHEYVHEIRGKQDGVSVLIIKKSNIKNTNFLSKIDVLTVIENEFKDCFVVGYPAIHENEEIEPYQCTYETSIGRHAYSVTSNRPVHEFGYTENESLQGLSGSGVLVIDNHKIYLAGIQIQSKKRQALVCINLIETIQNINSALIDHELPIIQQNEKISFDGITIKSTDLNFDLIQEKLSIKESLTEDDIKKLRKHIDSKTKELADYYLNLGIKYHKDGDSWRATYNLKLAIKYCPSHSIYLMQAKHLRTQKENQYLESKIETSEVSDNQKIEVIESIITQNEKCSNNELEKNYIKLLNIYEKNEVLYADRIRSIYLNLGNFYSKSDYKNCEKYFNAALQISNKYSEQKSSINIYGFWIKSAYFHREYQTALSLCKEALKLPKKNPRDTIKLYIILIKTTYLLDTDDPNIYVYYKKTKHLLNFLKKNSYPYQDLSVELNKLWIRLNGCIPKI